MSELCFHPVHAWLKLHRFSVVWLSKETEINRSHLHRYFHWLPEEGRFERDVSPRHAERIARAIGKPVSFVTAEALHLAAV